MEKELEAERAESAALRSELEHSHTDHTATRSLKDEETLSLRAQIETEKAEAEKRERALNAKLAQQEKTALAEQGTLQKRIEEAKNEGERQCAALREQVRSVEATLLLSGADTRAAHAERLTVSTQLVCFAFFLVLCLCDLFVCGFYMSVVSVSIDCVVMCWHCH